MRRRAVLVLTTLALALAASSGAATAETQNGPIYYPYGSMQYAALFSVDPPPAYPQPVQKTESGVNVQTYDISQDRKTLIYEQGCPGLCSSWSGMLWTLSRDEPNGAFFNGPEVMGVSNRWQCDRGSDDPDLNCSGQAMTQPTFSPDGETVYFVGQRLLSPDDPPGIYSVPTEGGEATRVPIEQGDGTPVVIDGLDGFDLSHHGSKLAFGGDHGIFTVPAGGGVPTRVTDEGCRGASSPSFSPDDRRIVYSSVIWSGDDCTGTGHRTVYAAPADGDGTSPGDALFPEDATDAVPGYTLAKYDPIYSPDGEQIAFVSWQDGFDHLAVAPATGGSITNVVRCVFCSPLWLEKPPPDTSIISGPPETTSSTTATLEFTSDQSGVSFECSLDDEAFEDCDSPASYSGLAEGPHAFEVRAVGVAGTDATPARRGFTVDLSIPPHVSDTNPENGKTRVPRAVKPRATFDTELDASTVTTDSVKMRVYNARKERWVSVPSSPSYASRVVTVTPENTLGSKKWYQVIFATGITSATGKNLEGAFRFSFTTRG